MGEDGGTTAAVEWPRRAGATVGWGENRAHPPSRRSLTFRYHSVTPVPTGAERKRSTRARGRRSSGPDGWIGTSTQRTPGSLFEGSPWDYRGDSRARFRRVLLVDLVVPVNDCMSLVGIMWECDM